MNKLLTNINGGFPLKLNDIRFEQESVRNAFKALLSAFNINPSNSFRISGAEVTINNDDYTTTGGYVSIDGEICEVEAHTITKSSPNEICWKIDASYDADGDKVFYNGQTQRTYQIRKAVLYNSPFGGPPPYNLPLLSDIIAQLTGADALSQSWTNINFNPDHYTVKSTGTFSALMGITRYKKIGKTLIFDVYVYGYFDEYAGLFLRILLPFNIPSNSPSRSLFGLTPDGTVPVDNYVLYATSIKSGNNSYISCSLFNGNDLSTLTGNLRIFGQIILEIE